MYINFFLELFLIMGKNGILQLIDLPKKARNKARHKPGLS